MTTIPANAAGWPAGPYLVSVEVTSTTAGAQKRRIVRTSAEAPLALAPSIDENPAEALIDREGRATITLKCTPTVWPAQRASLLFAMQEFVAEPLKRKGKVLSVDVAGIEPGTYPIRLRVQGVDSLLVDRSVRPPVYRNQVAVLRDAP